MNALARGRRIADSRMDSTVAVMRLTGDTTTDADGFTVPEWATVYTGKMRLGGADAGAAVTRRVTIGSTEFQLALRTASFPVGTALQDADFVEITAGEHAGLVLKVIEAEGQDQATALRVPVEETVRPAEWAA